MSTGPRDAGPGSSSQAGQGPPGRAHSPRCPQVVTVQAGGEVFVNQVYAQLPVSAGEGASPVPRGSPPLGHH